MKEVVFKFTDGSDLTIRRHGIGDIVMGNNSNATSFKVWYALNKAQEKAKQNFSLQDKIQFIAKLY